MLGLLQKTKNAGEFSSEVSFVWLNSSVALTLDKLNHFAYLLKPAVTNRSREVRVKTGQKDGKDFVRIL